MAGGNAVTETLCVALNRGVPLSVASGQLNTPLVGLITLIVARLTMFHHPACRTKYEINLKREFPRLTFYADFRQ